MSKRTCPQEESRAPSTWFQLGGWLSQPLGLRWVPWLTQGVVEPALAPRLADSGASPRSASHHPGDHEPQFPQIDLPGSL